MHLFVGHMSEPCKMAESVELPFGGKRTHAGPRNSTLDVGAYGRHLANSIEQFVLGNVVGCHYRYCRS